MAAVHDCSHRSPRSAPLSNLPTTVPSLGLMCSMSLRDLIHRRRRPTHGQQNEAVEGEWMQKGRGKGEGGREGRREGKKRKERKRGVEMRVKEEKI